MYFIPLLAHTVRVILPACHPQLNSVITVLPLRFVSYKQKAYHYFLFDLCYYVTILNFIYIWFLPGSASLLVACYCLSHGSLASAVITWRNSLVFHDIDKVRLPPAFAILI